MLQIFSFLTAFVADREEKGATATEYALIIAVIAAVIVASIALFGDALTGLWNDAIGEMNAA